MSRDWVGSLCLAFLGGMIVVAFLILALLVTFLVVVVVGVLALASKERNPVTQHLPAKLLGVERIIVVVRVHVLVVN